MALRFHAPTDNDLDPREWLNGSALLCAQGGALRGK
jgi:hypothetical protein